MFLKQHDFLRSDSDSCTIETAQAAPPSRLRLGRVEFMMLMQPPNSFAFTIWPIEAQWGLSLSAVRRKELHFTVVGHHRKTLKLNIPNRLIVQLIAVFSNHLKASSEERLLMSKSIKGYRKPTHEEIAACAQHLYEVEGRPEGKALDHWLRAEAQLIAERKAEAAAETAKAPQKASNSSAWQTEPARPGLLRN
jgi:Protein of unknown function (DUF2934)